MHSKENDGTRLTENIDKSSSRGTYLGDARKKQEGSEIKILLINCQSIVNKVVKFSVMVDMHNPDVIIGVESWLREDVGDREVFPDGYTVYRRDREDKKGGGVFILVRSEYKSKLDFKETEMEMLGITIGIEGMEDTHLIGIYRSEKGNEVLEGLVHRVEERLGCGSCMIVGGDLNLPEVNWNGDGTKQNRAQKQVNKLVWEGNLWQTGREATRGGNLLDVFLVRPKEIWKETEVVEGICDHKAVVMVVKLQPKISARKVGKGKRQYEKAEVVLFRDYLRQNFHNWVSMGGDVEVLWEGFKNLMRQGEELFVPIRKQRGGTDPPYYNRNIRSLKRKCREESIKIKKGGGSRERRKLIGIELTKAKKEAREAFLGSLVQSGRGFKEGWRSMYGYIKSQRGGMSSIPQLKGDGGRSIEEDWEKAEAFSRIYEDTTKYDAVEIVEDEDKEQNHNPKAFLFRGKEIYNGIKMIRKRKASGVDGITGELLKLGGWEIISYLKVLFNVSINNVSLPRDWREAIVIPIHKGGSRDCIGNYRPVSLTSVVGKLLEKIVGKYITGVCGDVGWLKEYQHGFREGYSCETQLIGYTQDLADVLDKGGRVDSVTLDLTKAFDRVLHEKLLCKINEMGLDRRVVHWVHAFLKGRGQRVRVGEALSERVDVSRGVPQGSILGPLLFTLYINDLPEVCDTKIRLFADDIIMYREIRGAADIRGLQTDIDRLMIWMSENGMRINGAKSHVVRFGGGKFLDEDKYEIGGECIVNKNYCKYLGVNIDCKLHWGNHIGDVVKKAYRSLYIVMRILKGCKKEIKERGYMQLVRPILEYCGSVWDPSQGYLIRELEGVQRKAARLVCGDFRWESSVTEMVKSLGWEDLKERRGNSTCIGMFKAYVGEPAWAGIRDKLETDGAYLGRKDHKYKIRLVQANKGVGRYSFIGRGIRQWNGLKKEVLDPFPRNIKELKKMMLYI